MLGSTHRTDQLSSAAPEEADAAVSQESSANLDDLDYSVHIAERDWSTFFQECEECDLLQAALAGLDDSGLSDMEEVDGSFLNKSAHTGLEVDTLESHLLGKGEEHQQGSTMEAHVNTGGHQASKDMPCGEEQDLEPGLVSCEGQQSSASSYKSTKQSHSTEPDLWNLPKDCPGKPSFVFDCLQSDVLSLPTKCEAYGNEENIDKENIELNYISCPEAQGKFSQWKKWDKTREAASSDANTETDCSETTESFTLAGMWAVKALTEHESLITEKELHNTCTIEAASILPGLSNNKYGHISNTSQSHQLPKPGEEGEISGQMANQACPEMTLVSSKEHTADLHMNSEVMSARPECFKTSTGLPRKEKERWFVTMDIDLARSRENVGVPVKKKKKKKKSCEVSIDCKDWGQAIQSTSEAERCRVGERQMLDTTLEGRSVSNSNREDSTAYACDTRHQHNSFSACQQPVCSAENSHTFIKFLSKDSNIKEPVQTVGLFLSKTYEESEEVLTPNVSEDKGQTEQKQENGSMLQKPENYRPRKRSCCREVSSWEQEQAHNTVDNLSIGSELSLKQCDYQESTESGMLDIRQTKQNEPNNNLNLSVSLHEKVSSFAMCKQEHIPLDKIQQELKFHTEVLTDMSALQLPICSPNSKHKGQHSHAVLKAIKNIPLFEKRADAVLDLDYRSGSKEGRTVLTKLNGMTENDTMAYKDSALSADGDEKPLIAIKKVEVSEACLDTNLLQVTSVQSMPEEPHTHQKKAAFNKLDSNEFSGEANHYSSHTATEVYSPTDLERQEAGHVECELLTGAEDIIELSSEHILSTAKLSEQLQSPIPGPADINMERIQGTAVSGGHASCVTGPNPGSLFQVGYSSSTEAELTSPSDPLTLDPTHPVYALSSFWDEMEKLTINDILHLRLVSHTQPLGDFSYVADTSDAAESGYFTYLDDSKPDRSSGEFSSFSDFEEEALHSLTSTSPSPEPQDLNQRHKKLPDISNTSELLRECKLHVTEITRTDNDSGVSMIAQIPQSHVSDNDHSLRSMSDHLRWQIFQAREIESQDVYHTPFLPSLENEEEIKFSFLSCHKAKQNVNSESEEVMNMDRNEDWRLHTSVPFLYTDMLPKCHAITVPEAYEDIFNNDERGIRTMHATCPVASFNYVNSCNLSVPEMYDYFFFDFDHGGFLFSPIQRCKKDEMVPIFSSSHAREKSLHVPEVHDYIDPHDSPIPSEDEEHYEPVCVVTHIHSRVKEPLDTMADAYEHFCTNSDWRGNLFWRNPFSVRGLHFTWRGLSQPAGCPVSWWSTAMDRRGYLFFGTKRPATPQQVQARRSFPLTMNQSDMSLVCIAFASWVLKSTSPQNLDTWKTVLLANISAISAIRYLRRYIGDGSSGDKR